MYPNHDQERSGRAGAHSSVSDARSGAPAIAPSSKTGRKNDEGIPLACREKSVSGFTGTVEGEHFECFTDGKHAELVRYPVPSESTPARVAFVDYLTFTLVPPPQIALVSRIEGLEDSGYRWVVGEVERLFKVAASRIERRKTGCFGFKRSAVFDGGLIAWGGDNQRGRIMVSFSGEGCSRWSGEDMPVIAAWLESHNATITRIDLAHDDITGEHVTMGKIVEAYRAGGFNAGGRRPGHRLDGDWLDGEQSVKGRTLNVGKRENGKLFRGYEKGKQLGDSASRWVRLECEWHNKSRELRYCMLTRPGQYLAGAYPYLGFLGVEQCRVKTVFRSAKVAFARAMHFARLQVGKLVNLALEVYEGDYAKVVECLRRDGWPAKIEPYSYHVSREPERLADDPAMIAGYAG